MAGKGKKLSGRICIEVDGKMIPFLSIDADGNKTWHVSEDDRRSYTETMLKNMGEAMSDYYNTHPYPKHWTERSTP